MAYKKTIKKAIRIEDIHINIPECPGCGHEHDIVPNRPQTRRNCSHGKGTYNVTISSAAGGGLTVEVKFTDISYKEVEIGNIVQVTVGD